MSFLRRLFKEANPKNVITLFHAPSSPASQRALTILKTAAAQSAPTATATQDQASSHATQSKLERVPAFELDVTEAPPTTDQLRSIFEFLGPGKVGDVVEGASAEGEAVRAVEEGGGRLRRPVVVDWHNGKAVVGGNESEIMNLIKALPKNT